MQLTIILIIIGLPLLGFTFALSLSDSLPHLSTALGFFAGSIFGAATETLCTRRKKVGEPKEDGSPTNL